MCLKVEDHLGCPLALAVIVRRWSKHHFPYSNSKKIVEDYEYWF
jgi:hypothetical protein